MVAMDSFAPLIFHITYVSLFLYILGTAGEVAGKLLRLEIDSISLRAMLAFLLIVMALWFLRMLPKSINTAYAAAAIVIAVSAFFVLTKRLLNNKRDIFIVIPTVTVVSLIYTYVAHGKNLVLIGNNDLFNWYSVAAQLSGEGNYFNMAPAAEAGFKNFRLDIDGFGTDWFLIFASLGTRELIMSAQTALIILGSWVALSFQDQLKKFLRIGLINSVILSCLAVATPLFIYISFNGFFAHLLATVAGIHLVSAVVESRLSQSPSRFYRFAIFFIPTLFILLVYQSGFIVFQLIALGLAVLIYMPLSRAERREGWAKRFVREIGFPYLFAVACSFVVLPEIAVYMVTRTLQVSDASVGWPLPPAVPEFAAKYLSVLGSAAAVTVIYSLLSLCVLSVLIVTTRRLAVGECKRVLLRGLIWIGILLIIYFFWFVSTLSPYQNWKYASFFIYLLCFSYLVPIALYADRMNRSRSSRRQVGNIVWFAVPSILVLSTAWSVYYLVDYHKRATVYDQNVDELSQIKRHLPVGWPLILDLPAYGYTMLAMQMLSSNNALYPLSQTYIPPATPADILRINKPLLLRAKPVCGHNYFAEVLYESPLYIFGYAKSDIFRFDLPLEYTFAERCVPRWLTFTSGVSGWERWGRWSDGNVARFRLTGLHRIAGRPLFMEWDVSPYLPPGLAAQRVRIKVNDRPIIGLSIAARRIVKVAIPSDVLDGQDVDVAFDLPDAKSPSARGSSDTRALGLAFYSLRVYSVGP